MPLLEVISVSPFDSLTIQQSGADRIQLVSALQIGGLTPSRNIIRKSLQSVSIPTMVMIRHHNNGFVYSQKQQDLMCEQVKDLIQIGVKGIVVGGLKQNKHIDTQFINKIQSQIATNKVQITFHKAIDYTTDIVKSYDQLSKLNITRILTQGGQLPIINNAGILSQLVQKSINEKSTKILLGGGITHENVKQIINKTQCQQIHIGTCVRKNKYEAVCKDKLEVFINLIKS